MFRTLSIAILAVVTLLPAFAYAGEWSEAKELRQRRRGVIVSYRAKLEGSWLIVEATHGEGWHTYSLDNTERARKVTGLEFPDTELPTVIEISGGLSPAGPWHQSKPKDLSNKDIKWYTWGFEGTSFFAVPVERTSGDTVTLTINAQACNQSACSMVNDMQITLDLPATLADASPEELLKGMIASTKEQSEE